MNLGFAGAQRFGNFLESVELHIVAFVALAFGIFGRGCKESLARAFAAHLEKYAAFGHHNICVGIVILREIEQGFIGKEMLERVS